MWTSYLIERDPRTAVTCFADHGWRFLELSDEHGHDLLKQGDPLKVGAAFRRFAADLGVTLSQGHFYLCSRGCRPGDEAGRAVADIAPADDAAFETAMEDMRRWIDLFNGLGVKAGVLHAGGLGLKQAGWSDQRILDRRAEALTRVAAYARGGTTLICMENLTRGIGFYSAQHALELLHAVDAENVGICLDTGHAHFSGEDPAQFVRAAGGRLKALHIADNLGQGDDHMLPYGRGTVKWTGVMQALREVGYDGLFNFEVPGENRCPAPIRLAKLDYALKLAHWMIESDGV